MSYRMLALVLTCAALTAAVAIWPETPARAAPAEAALAEPNAPPPAQPAAGPAAQPGIGHRPLGAPAIPMVGNANQQGVAAIVNDQVISDYDVDQRVRMFLVTSGIRNPTEQDLKQIRQQVLHAMEDETLELQEATKHKITIKKQDVDQAIQNVAKDNGLSPAQLEDALKNGGVTMQTFRSQITAQLSWNRLVDARYGGTFQISPQEIDNTLKRIKEGADKPQYNVAEIFLSVDTPEDDAQVKKSAEQIARQLSLGAIFPNVARQFSQAPSAAGGGNIGWVQQGDLPPALDQALRSMQPGQIRGPIKSEGGYYILMLHDRRAPAGTQAVKAPPPPTPDSSLPLDRFLLPLPPTAPKDLRQKAVTFAENVRSQLRTCEDLPATQKQIQGSVLQHLGTIKLDTLAKNFRDAIMKTPPGGVTEPIVSPAGVELIMRCDPAVRQVVPFVVPTRDQIEQQLYVQQMGVLARSYLRDLRRDAVVETR